MKYCLLCYNVYQNRVSKHLNCITFAYITVYSEMILTRIYEISMKYYKAIKYQEKYKNLPENDQCKSVRQLFG